MDIQINGQNYKTGKLDAFQQLHVSRRLAPAFFALASSASSLGEVLRDTDQLKAIEPLIKAIAGMSDQDMNYVLAECLAVVQREQQGGWANVLAGPNTLKLMFSDIDLRAMMQLTATVIKENLGGFFPDLTTQS